MPDAPTTRLGLGTISGSVDIPANFPAQHDTNLGILDKAVRYFSGTSSSPSTVDTSPIAGDLYQNTSTGIFSWYTGSAWILIATGGSSPSFGALTVTGDGTVDGTLGVVGAISADADTFQVTGGVTTIGALTAGNAGITNNLSVGGNAGITNNLTVGINALVDGNLNAGTLTVTGDGTVNEQLNTGTLGTGTLTVTGDGTVDGTLSTGTLGVGGNATVDGTLGVDGTVTAGGVTVGTYSMPSVDSGWVAMTFIGTVSTNSSYYRQIGNIVYIRGSVTGSDLVPSNLPLPSAGMGLQSIVYSYSTGGTTLGVLSIENAGYTGSLNPAVNWLTVGSGYLLN